MKSKTTGTMTVIALGAMLAGVLVVFRSASIEATYPVSRAVRAFSAQVCSRVGGFFRGAEAQAENRRLRRELAAYKLNEVYLRRLETENARLRRMLDYSAHSPETWIPAGVLAQGGGAAGNTHMLRVDRGSLAGIRIGAAVVSEDGVVGRVTAVTPHTAEIMTLPSASVKVSCRIETGGKSAPLGILEGGSDSLLVLRRLRQANLPTRARVVTSGLGGVFPKGLVVGTLAAASGDAQGISGDRHVLPAVDFASLEDVFIRREK